MSKLRNTGPVAVGLVLATLFAGTGMLLTRVVVNRAQAIHRQDLVTLQGTLANLGHEYVLSALAAEEVAASGQDWSLAPGSPADRAALEAVAQSSPVANFGAELLSPSGRVLGSWSREAGLPAPYGPAYAPMFAALRAGRPGLTSVVDVHGVALAGFAVPILQAGRPAAVLVGFSDLAASPLQQYARKLRYGPTGIGYLVDSTGTVVASAGGAPSGEPLATSPALRLLLSGRSGFTRYAQGGEQMVAAYHPFGVGGWGGITVESARQFYGPIDSAAARVELALVALLLVALCTSVLLERRRVRAAAGERRSLVELEAARDRLVHLATHDPLTGLANRTVLMERLDEALERGREGRTPVGLIYLDLDNFKQVNDALGHETGDQVLIAVAERINAAVRPSDLVARVGGDEIVVLCDELGRGADAEALLRRIEMVTSVPLPIGEAYIAAPASLGIALSSPGSSARDMLREADCAMFQAKKRKAAGGALAMGA